jgi:hypothetical protein
MAVEPNTSTQNGLPPGEDAEVALRCRLGQITILLDREQGVSTKVPEKPSWSYRDNLGRHPHLLAWFIPVALVILAVVVGLSIHLLTRSTLIQTADYRWGPHYNDHVISDAVDVPDRAAVVLSTRGGGVHTLDRKANYWRQYTRQNTRGRLLRDDVLSVETDAGGNFYFLCTQDGLNGLCRASPDLGRWNVLIGLDQFKALAGPKPARPTAVVQHGGTVWLTTDSAGVGEYDRTSHQWTSFYTTDNSGLGSNAVFDAVATADGTIYFGTDAGISMFKDDQWVRHGDAARLAGLHVRQVLWAGDRLWYRTQGMGVGTLQSDGAARVCVSEGSWRDVGDADIRAAVANPDQTALWLVAKDRVGRYDVARRGWLSLPAMPREAKINDLAVAPAAKESSELLWTASSDGVWSIGRDETAWHESGLQGQNVTVVGPGEGFVAAGLQRAADGPFDVVLRAEGKDKPWLKTQGGGAAGGNQADLVTAALEPQGQRIIAADPATLWIYDTGSREWVGRYTPKDLGLPTGKIGDLAWQEGGLWCLVVPDGLAHVDMNRKACDFLFGGGGVMAGDPARLTAVDVGPDGCLWMAADRGLNVYDPAWHRWTAVGGPQPIDQIVCASTGTWLLSSGSVYYVDAQDGNAPREGRAVGGRPVDPRVGANAGAPCLR